jgi:electron transfer flavoprotein alpha subunit
VNSVFVYCEITEEGHVSEVSLELLSKGRKLANQLKTKLEAVLIGNDQVSKAAKSVFPFGVDVAHIAVDKRLFPYLTLPHAAIVSHVFKQEQPDVAIFGATSIGRDLAPRIASALKCGLTADCTSLEIGDHTETKTQKEFKNLLVSDQAGFWWKYHCHHHQSRNPSANGNCERRCDEKRNTMMPTTKEK